MYDMYERGGLPKHEVLDYLRRVIPNAKTTNEKSQSRNFERFKKRLDKLGIEYETTVEPVEGAIFKIKEIGKAKTLVEKILENEVQQNGKTS